MHGLGRVAANDDPRLNAEWIELQRRRASLAPTEQALPVHGAAQAMDSWRFGYASPGDAGTHRLVTIKPVLRAGKSGDQAVRVGTLEAFLNTPEAFIAEDDTRQAAARDWV